MVDIVEAYISKVKEIFAEYDVSSYSKLSQYRPKSVRNFKDVYRTDDAKYSAYINFSLGSVKPDMVQGFNQKNPRAEIEGHDVYFDLLHSTIRVDSRVFASDFYTFQVIYYLLGKFSIAHLMWNYTYDFSPMGYSDTFSSDIKVTLQDFEVDEIKAEEFRGFFALDFSTFLTGTFLSPYFVKEAKASKANFIINLFLDNEKITI